VLSSGEEIAAADVALHLGAPAADADVGLPPLEEMERRHIIKVLQHTAGNRARAAKILGIDPKTLYNKLKGYDVWSG
jgi:DNA-binding NtrC family response regulator